MQFGKRGLIYIDLYFCRAHCYFVDLYPFFLNVLFILNPGKHMQMSNTRAKASAQKPVASSRWKTGTVKPVLITTCHLKSPLLMASKILVPGRFPITSTLTLMTAGCHLACFSQGADLPICVITHITNCLLRGARGGNCSNIRGLFQEG